MFRGNHLGYVDQKGRLKLPADFKRTSEATNSHQFYVTSGDDESAAIYPLKEWEALQSKLEAVASMSPPKRKLPAITERYGTVVEMDSQGRMLLPRVLRERANLSVEVAILGRQTFLEVINADAFRGKFNRIEADLRSEEESIAVVTIDGHFRVVSLSPDGTYSFLDETRCLHNILYVCTAETRAFKLAIDELEHLINDPKTKEKDLQAFFERNPDLIKGEEHKEAHAHVVLSRENGDLIPDFVLEPHNPNDLCDLLEVKLPSAKVFTLKTNRHRFSSAVLEGCAQLREYARFFDEQRNRELIAAKYQLRAYKPKMFLIIGRRGEVDPIQRRDMALDNPTLELKTYDDLVSRAQVRLRQMQSSSRRFL